MTVDRKACGMPPLSRADAMFVDAVKRIVGAHLADIVASQTEMLMGLYDLGDWRQRGISWLEYVELEATSLEFKHVDLLVMIAKLVERERP